MDSRLVIAALTLALARPTEAQLAREVEAPIARVVAQVSDVWIRDVRYQTFRTSLADKYPDTPELATFMQDEQWVTVISSYSMVYPGVFKGRAPAEMKLVRGDVVEMRIADYTKAKTYRDLSQVIRVLCKAGASDYVTCAKANARAWYGVNGQLLVPPM